MHDEALALTRRVTGQPARDVNYIIPTFVLTVLPIGLVGIFIAGVMAAAMSSIAAELNSLATATVIDFYRRWVRPTATDSHYLTVSKGATLFWGAFACVVATYAATLGSLIEVVNRFGSFFYGSILGVFLLAMVPRARAAGAFIGLIAGMTTVAAVNLEQLGRTDDTEQIIANRLAIYERETAPILDVYRERGIALEIDGVGTLDEITDRVIAALEARGLIRSAAA